MSAFDEYHKDGIVDAIDVFVAYKKEKNPEIKIYEIVSEIMEAVNLSIRSTIYEMEENKKE